MNLFHKIKNRNDLRPSYDHHPPLPPALLRPEDHEVGGQAGRGARPDEAGVLPGHRLGEAVHQEEVSSAVSSSASERSHHVRPDGPGLARGEVLHQDGAVVSSPPLDLSLTQDTAQWSLSQEWFTLEPVILVYLAHTSRVKAVMVRLAMAPPSN